MSNMTCPICGAAAPDDAYYCMHCAQPIRCKNCRASIPPNAHACMQCGTFIPERESSQTAVVGSGAVPPGYNRLSVHQKSDLGSNDVDFIFSDAVGQQAGEVIKHLAGFGEAAGVSRPMREVNQVPGTLEYDNKSQATPQLTAAPHGHNEASKNGVSPGVAESYDEIKAIHYVFAESDGELSLQITDLKANNTQRDYALRLIHMFLYARKVLFNISSTSRAEILEVTNFASLPPNSIGVYLSDDKDLDKHDDGGGYKLKLAGIEHARQCFKEIMDPAVPSGSVIPSAEARSANKEKKGGKRVGKQVNGDKMAAILGHAETNLLVSRMPHDALSKMPAIDKVLVALYGLSKAGVEGGIFYAAIEEYLYKVFQIPLGAESVRTAVRRARENNSNYLVYKDSEGCQITRTGASYVESKLQGSGDLNSAFEQAELAES